MFPIIKKGKAEGYSVWICKTNTKLTDYGLSEQENLFVKSQIENEKNFIEINQYNKRIYIVLTDILFGKKTAKKTLWEKNEAFRKAGDKIAKSLNNYKSETITIMDIVNDKNAVLCVAEGMALGNYQFLKYLKNAKEKQNSLKTIFIQSKNISPKEVEHLQITTEAVCIARTLINEPVSFLTAEQLSKEIQQLGKGVNFKVEVFDKKKIEELKMGGILAVNKGSIDEPRFNILEWKPKNHRNKKPFVLVGKGVVYDTGGLSLKPTPNSMDEMKCDMSGAAAVTCTIYAAAKSKLPLHIIGLIPSTDNRPGGNAYTPGDIITHYDGTTDEVLNTDAEGRLILADALAYAKRYNPELVIDLATLTGACVRAIGTSASDLMGTADEKTKTELKKSGYTVFERLHEFPFWDDYGEMMKSDIADLKNVSGSANSGAITAGKFLEHFTKNSDGENAYPWIHLDIAGPAFLSAAENYRGKGGTGVGVRLLFDFLKNKI